MKTETKAQYVPGDAIEVELANHAVSMRLSGPHKIPSTWKLATFDGYAGAGRAWIISRTPIGPLRKNIPLNKIRKAGMA